MCASNANFVRLSTNQAAALAIKLAKEKAVLCEPIDKPCTSSSLAAHNATGEEEDDDEEFFAMNDDDDVIVPSSSASSRVGSASASTSAHELKSMNDALNDAVKFVKEISEQKRTDKNGLNISKSSILANKKTLYLNEKRIENLIKKCKQNLADYRNREHSGK